MLNIYNVQVRLHWQSTHYFYLRRDSSVVQQSFSSFARIFVMILPTRNVVPGKTRDLGINDLGYVCAVARTRTYENNMNGTVYFCFFFSFLFVFRSNSFFLGHLIYNTIVQFKRYVIIKYNHFSDETTTQRFVF